MSMCSRGYPQDGMRCTQKNLKLLYSNVLILPGSVLRRKNSRARACRPGAGGPCPRKSRLLLWADGELWATVLR